MVDLMKMAEPINRRQMDDLTGLWKDKLRLNLDQSAYRQLAQRWSNFRFRRKKPNQMNMIPMKTVEEERILRNNQCLRSCSNQTCTFQI
jgi:hypothetical protein